MSRVTRIGLAAGLLAVLVAGCDNAGRDNAGQDSTAQHSSAGRSVAQSADGASTGDKAAAVGKAGELDATSGNAGGRAPAASAPTAGAASTAQPALPALGREVIRTGQLTVQTPDVPGTILKATAAVQSAGGYLAGQQATINPDHRRDTATLTLKVPGSAYDRVLTALSKLGTVLASSDQRDDVTGAVLDASSRLATERASVARVRALLSRARTIGEVVAVESELTKREANLESLQARLAALKGQVSYATITLQLETPGTAPERPKDTGLIAGLRAGWHAFTTVLVGLLTAVGAAAPFAVTLLVLAQLAFVIRRRFLRRPPTPAPE